MNPAPPSDDLQSRHAHALDCLARAADEPRSPLRTPVLATVGLDGSPQLRTVILRGLERGPLRLYVYTDARSRKVAEIAARPRVELLAYDPERRLQLRLAARASAHHDDPLAAAHWARLSVPSRYAYGVEPAPGSSIEHPVLADAALASADERRQYAQFTVLVLDVATVEWLFLERSGHRRARFDLDDGGLGAWLAP